MMSLVLPSFHDDLGIFILEHYVKRVFEDPPRFKMRCAGCLREVLEL